MRPEQPLTPEGEYLLYLLQVSEDGTLPALRLEMPTRGEYWNLTWLERQERAAGYALGRIRESVCNRIKRLPPEATEQRELLFKVLINSQDQETGKVVAPRYPAQALSAIVGILRTRLTTTNRRAA